MVFVKVRETYDLHTIRNKMSIIGIHTPGAEIVKKNYPGLLMQCTAYRPVSCDVRIACASMMPLDVQGVGTTEGDVAPEDVFNPILYKAMSNFGMSQLDQYVNSTDFATVERQTADLENNVGFTADEFNIYYGLLSQTHNWKHASPQQGLSMSGLKPLVYETYQTIGDNSVAATSVTSSIPSIGVDDTIRAVAPQSFRGSSHVMPMLNCTSVATTGTPPDLVPREISSGFYATAYKNAQVDVPAPKVFVGCIIIPPSRLHQLFYRMVVEWTLEFSKIRPLSDLMTFSGLAALGNDTHYMSYSFSSSKLAEETSMVDTTEGSDITKVM